MNSIWRNPPTWSFWWLPPNISVKWRLDPEIVEILGQNQVFQQTESMHYTWQTSMSNIIAKWDEYAKILKAKGSIPVNEINITH
jgi:viroplasmin and RNaseH domain-containing protein